MDKNFALVVHGLSQGFVYTLIAIGFSLIYRSTGLLNLAFGELVMIGSLVGFSALAGMGMPFIGAAALCMIVVAVLSLGMEKVVFQRIRGGGNIDNALVAGIGLMIVANQVGLLGWGADSLAYPETTSGGAVSIGSASVAVENLWIMGICVAAVLVLHWFLHHTVVGIGMRAAADDRLASQLVGISPTRSAAAAALISGALGGLAGILLGSLYYASFSLGAIGIKGVAAATIGGFGDIRGAIAGGLLLGLVESFGTAYLSANVSVILAWILMILVLMVRPQGIFAVVGRRDD